MISQWCYGFAVLVCFLRAHAGSKSGSAFTAEEEAEGFLCFGTEDYQVRKHPMLSARSGPRYSLPQTLPFIAATLHTESVNYVLRRR